MSHSPDLEGRPVLQDVLVCHATPGSAWVKSVQAPANATVQEIVLLSGFFSEHPDKTPESQSYGVFGQQVSPDSLVRLGDRIEIYRPLTFDPKESRRRRAAHRSSKALRKPRLKHNKATTPSTRAR